MKTFILLLVLLQIPMFSAHAAGVEAEFPPQLAVPFLASAPRMDGVISGREWSSAAELSGFVSKKQWDSRGMTMYAGYDAQNLYLAWRLPFYPQGKKPKATWNRRDQFPPQGFEEDRIEILLDPHAGQHTVEKGHFMFFINAAGNIVYDQQWTEAEGVQKDWNLNARIKSRCTENFWEGECAIPFSELGVERPKNGQIWFLQMSRYWSDFGSWTTFSPVAGILNSHQAGARMVFLENSPGYRVQISTDGQGARASAEVYNKNRAENVFSGQLATDGKIAAEAEKTVSGEEGTPSRLELGLPAKLADNNLFRLRLTSAETLLYQAEIPFLKKAKLPEITADMREKKFIFMARYLPYYEKAWLDLLDFSVLEQAAAISRVDFQVLDQAGKKLFQSALAFQAGKAEHLEIPLPGLIRDDGMYRFAVVLSQGEKEIAREYIDYEYKNFPFVGSSAGTSIEIFPGFQPIEWKDQTAGMVSSQMRIGQTALFDQIAARQTEPTVGGEIENLLADPIRLTGKINGREVLLQGNGFEIRKQARNQMEFTAKGRIGELDAGIRNLLEYDGFSWIELTLQPTHPVKLESLTLEIPLRPDQATLMYEISDKRLGFLAGATSSQQGVIWDSMQQPNTAGTFGNFKPMLWVGNEDRGLTWFAESDRFWSLDERRPALELVRESNRVVLRVHFVNRALELTKSRTIAFGIQPTPSKPLPANWRSWLVGANPALPNIRSFRYSAAVSRDSEAAKYHAWCSYNPYPESYEEAKTAMDQYRSLGQVFLRYQLVDWIRFMTQTPEGKVYRGEWERVWMNSFTKSFQDFKAYHYDQYLKKAGFFTVYEDEAYLRPMRDLALDAGYLRPDGEIQAEFGIRGLRETLRRCASVWIENGMPNHYAVHKSGVTMTPCHSFAAISIDGEQRFLDNPNRDYLDNWPLDFVRSHIMGRQFGVVPVFLSEVRLSMAEYGEEKIRQANRSLVALMLLHDIITWHAWNVHPPTRDLVHRAKSDFNLGADSVRFHPYWSAGSYRLCDSNTDSIKISAWQRGDHLFIVAVNLGQQDALAEITFRPQQIGYLPGVAVDYESRQNFPIREQKIQVPVSRHDFRILFAGKTRIDPISSRATAPVRIKPAPQQEEKQPAEEKRPQVDNDLLFHLPLDGTLQAVSALGDGKVLQMRGSERYTADQQALQIGKDGIESISYPALNHFFAPEGSVFFRFKALDFKELASAPRGVYQLFYLTGGKEPGRWGLQLQRDQNKTSLALISIRFPERKDVFLSTAQPRFWKNQQWHQIALTWDDREMVLYLDGLVAARKTMETPWSGKDFADKIIKIGYETGVPGNENFVLDDLRVYCRKLSSREIQAFQEKHPL